MAKLRPELEEITNAIAELLVMCAAGDKKKRERDKDKPIELVMLKDLPPPKGPVWGAVEEVINFAPSGAPRLALRFLGEKVAEMAKRFEERQEVAEWAATIAARRAKVSHGYLIDIVDKRWSGIDGWYS